MNSNSNAKITKRKYLIKLRRSDSSLLIMLNYSMIIKIFSKNLRQPSKIIKVLNINNLVKRFHFWSDALYTMK